MDCCGVGKRSAAQATDPDHWEAFGVSSEPVAFAATEVKEAARNSGGIFLKWSSETVSLFSPPWGMEGTGCPVTASSPAQ